MHYHYLWLSVLSILSALLLADLITAPALLWGDIRVMHSWKTVPANWESLGPPPAGTKIDLYIALRPDHENALIDALYEVSDPNHRKYGAHLTKEQVAELVEPHRDTFEIVYSWLEHHGVPFSSVSTSHGGGWLAIAGVPVFQANQLLCASYQVYRHTGTGESGAILRTVSYALPAALHGHVQTVAPTTHFASPRTPLQIPRRRSSEEAVLAVNATSGKPVRVLSGREEDDLVTPSFLRWLYKTQAYVPSAMGQNMLGTLGFLDDFPIQTDLTQFMSNFREDAMAATFAVANVNGGGYDSSKPGAYGSVQTQYAEAMAYPAPYTFYSTGGNFEWSLIHEPAPSDGYLQWLNYVLIQPDIPRTIGISYGNPELEFPPAYAITLCKLFARLGVLGVSVLAASGNDGVGRGDCNDGSGNVLFMTMFPASCPWVTSVGGTTDHSPEVAATFSGGGFSLYFLRPSYQDDAAADYLPFFGLKYAGLYQSVNRGVPDIAAQAQRFVYVYNNVLYEMSGTICSTSTASGIVSLLNDYQLSKGRAPLGFLNPWLYSRAHINVNDIVSGSNPGCNTDGFFAKSGWDPVTGLGTLDFEKLQHAHRYLGSPGSGSPNYRLHTH